MSVVDKALGLLEPLSSSELTALLDELQKVRTRVVLEVKVRFCACILIVFVCRICFTAIHTAHQSRVTWKKRSTFAMDAVLLAQLTWLLSLFSFPSPFVFRLS